MRRPSALARSFASGLALALGLAFAPPVFAQQRTPVPTPPPEGAQAGTAPARARPSPAEPTTAGALPVEGPVPEARPDAPAPGEPSAEAPKPVEKPSTDKPDAAAPGGTSAAKGAKTTDEPQGPPAPAEGEPVPQPAYVPPDKARTEPEPGAPEVPDMTVTPAQTVEAAAAVEDAVACEKELKARGAEFTVGETIAEGQCGVLRPVSVTKLSSGVTISPGTVFLCRTALALDIWVSEGVEPAAKEEFDGAKVKALTQASTYSCRARASESRISEHSRGSAIDIAGFELGDGKTVPVDTTAPGTAGDRFAARVRRAACGPFRTVLGPGTDSDHGTHLHLDIAARSNDTTYCR